MLPMLLGMHIKENKAQENKLGKPDSSWEFFFNSWVDNM